MECNAILALTAGLASFLFGACALVMDFLDKDRGTLYRKCIYMLGMLYNATLLIHFDQCNNGPYLWFFITLVQFIEKVAHFHHREKLINDRFSLLRRALKQSHTFAK